MDYEYLSSVFKHIGILINNDLKQEIIYYFPLVFSEKSSKYEFKTSYVVLAQPLGTFFVDFINVDFNNIDEFKEFFLKYPSSILDKNYKKIIKKNEYSESEFNELLNKIYDKKVSTLKKIQRQVDEILDYTIIHPRRNKEFTPTDRLLVLQTVHENLTLLRNNSMETLTFYKLNNAPISNKTENELYDMIKKNEHSVEKITVSIPTSIESLIYFSLCNVIENNLILKICKNCNNYFFANNSKTEYCNNIAPYSDKTCIEIGRNNSFIKTLNEDDLLERYYKIYHRKATLARRNPDIKEYVKSFDNYKKFGKIKLADYKSKSISKEEFKSWLDKKDKFV